MTIVKSGFYCSIQDLGRIDYRHLGIPHSGVMDELSASYANACLDNKKGSAVIEIIGVGGTYIFSEPTFICITGAKAMIKVNSIAIEQYDSIKIQTGDQLEIGAAVDGNFIYLGIAGGFEVPEVLGSKSFFKGITKQQLTKGDTISYRLGMSSTKSVAKFPKPTNSSILKCFPGPEFHFLNRKQQEQLLNSSFTVSKNWNRMAFQLNEKIDNQLIQLKSSPVLPGTVQLTPSGQLIILMKDAQTTGGYPRILQLDKASISILSQKRKGTSIDFLIL
ncbi:5-oxoprolinase subunit C family protein [Nonlabens dokdonensis]|nr:biotin-dependent carboxyltransferase family protein [Nonlabens dokdonensis]